MRRPPSPGNSRTRAAGIPAGSHQPWPLPEKAEGRISRRRASLCRTLLRGPSATSGPGWQWEGPQPGLGTPAHCQSGLITGEHP